MGRRRVITLKLTEVEAEALMRAGNAGIADLIDEQTDEAEEVRVVADAVMDRLGALMADAWPSGGEVQHG
ncbi:MAG: hypothetical protein ACJ786_17420 [Catenulispora sp.]